MEKSKLLPKGGKSFALILLCMLLYIFFEEFVFAKEWLFGIQKIVRVRRKEGSLKLIHIVTRIESKIIYTYEVIFISGIIWGKIRMEFWRTMEILGNRRKLDIYSALGCRKTWLPLSDPTFQRLR